MYGKDSYVGNSRFPKSTFGDLASLLAVPYDQETIGDLATEKFVLTDMVADDRGLIATQCFSIDKHELKEDENAKTTYFTEELISMVLQYGKMLSEKQAEGTGAVKDAVITVPSYYNQE